MLPPSVTTMCLLASPATSACASQLIMEIQGWPLCPPPKLPFCLELESWGHGKFWSSADDRQLPRLPFVNLAYFSSTFLSSQSFRSSHLFLDLTDSLLLRDLSLLPSRYPFLPYTCMDKRLPASANPSQTPISPQMSKLTLGPPT